MSRRGLGLFPSPRSLVGLQGRGPCPLPYRPICPQYCREKGRFTPYLLLRRCCILCHSHMQSPPCVHLLGRRQTKQADKNKQTNKPTDNQTDRQTEHKQRQKNKNTKCLALPVLDRGQFTLAMVAALLISIFPVEPNLYWRFTGKAASRALSP